MRVDWATLKRFVDNTELFHFVNYMEMTDNTYVWLSYQNESFNVLLDYSTVEWEDFNTNYKPRAILKNDLAMDGMTYVKNTHVLAGRLLKAHFVEFKTSSTWNNDVTGLVHSHMFDEQGAVTQDESQCVKTAIDFAPNFTYEIYGGGLTTLEDVAGNYYVSCIVAPDIPSPHGSFCFVINKKIINPTESVFISGIGPSEITYNAQIPTASVIRIELRHPKGIQKTFQSELQYYV